MCTYVYLQCTYYPHTHTHITRADPVWDVNPLKIYYTTRDPDNSDLTVNLFISAPPYTTSQQFDPNFGAHDAFLLNGPYIFAQRTDADNNINLYVSHMRKPFQLAKIPTPYNHQSYLVSHIDELQAMVVIEHEGNFYNLYLSDTSGVDYSLSLRDIVVERGSILDLEIVSSFFNLPQHTYNGYCTCTLCT